MMDSQEAERLRASEEKYRRMIESAIDGILLIATDTGLVVGANPQASEMTSYSLQELRQRRVWELHPDDEREAARALFERVRDNGFGCYEDLHFARKDGSEIAIDVRANVIEFAGRRVIQRICRDVTERKARERALERRRVFEDLVLRISTRFINIPVGPAGYQVIRGALAELGEFAEVHRSYVYVLEGDGMSQMFVWGAEGVAAFDTLRRVDLTGFEWALERLDADETVTFERAEVYPYEGIEASERIRALAKKYPVPQTEPGTTSVRRHSISVPIRSDGRLLGFLGFDQLGAPMTWGDEALRLLRMVGNILGNTLARMSAEEALMRANDALEAKVQARTRELQDKQAQLVQSEKMASLGQLVAGVAHEMNTPLGALLSGARTIRRVLTRIDAHPDVAASTASDLKRWVGSANTLALTMANAGARIDEVVTSLRRFAQLDRSAIGELDLRVAMEDVLTLIGARLPAGVQVERAYDEDLPQITCRAADVHQLLLNLLVNAKDAVPRDGRIRVALRSVTSGVEIEVEDDGPGIPGDVLPKIYDPGFTTKGVGGGAGFGLAIAHRIVADHGGTIEADSPAGARFRVWLPLRFGGGLPGTAGSTGSVLVKA